VSARNVKGEGREGKCVNVSACALMFMRLSKCACECRVVLSLPPKKEPNAILPNKYPHSRAIHTGTMCASCKLIKPTNPVPRKPLQRMTQGKKWKDYAKSGVIHILVCMLRTHRRLLRVIHRRFLKPLSFWIRIETG